MRMFVLVALTLALAAQQGLPGLPFKAGPADLVLALAVAAGGIAVLRRRGRGVWSWPPVCVSAFAAVILTAGITARLADPSVSMLKEGLQAMEICLAGWLAWAWLIGGEVRHARTAAAVLVAVTAIEAIAVLGGLFLAGDRFHGGFLTADRNGFAMPAMTGLPLAAALAAMARRPVVRAAACAAIVLLVCATTAAGALVGGVAGVIVVALIHPDRRRLLAPGAALLAGLILTAALPVTRQMAASSIAVHPRDNRLLRELSDADEARLTAFHETYRQWFDDGTALRYRRWGYALHHAAASPRSLIIGSGPGSFNTALKPWAAADGKPPVNTNETMLFNLAADEPGSFGAWWVMLVETGLAGVLALAGLLGAPLAAAVRAARRGSALHAGAAGSLIALLIVCIFHSPFVTGMNLAVMLVIYLAVMPAEAAPAGGEVSGTRAGAGA
ncbi:MAG: hypothetical protein ABIF71_14000 [Planctomycetota bacterium]